MMKKGWFVIGLVFALLIGPAILASADTVVVVDQAGNPVTIERPVDRIVSIDGIGTYYVYALGRGDSLVAAWYIGVKGLEKAPEGLFRLEPRLPEILRFGDPNVEEMVSLDPDLIIVNGSRHGAFAAQMNDLGVPTIQLLVETPGALKDSLRLIAAAIGGDTIPRAEALVADYDRVFDTVETSLSGLPESRRPRVLFIGTDKLRVASGDMYQSYLIEVSGGVSITSSRTAVSTRCRGCSLRWTPRSPSPSSASSGWRTSSIRIWSRSILRQRLSTSTRPITTTS